MADNGEAAIQRETRESNSRWKEKTGEIWKERYFDDKGIR
jgi:hypothetical protein